MAIYRTKDRLAAVRFARILVKRGYQRIPNGRRKVKSGTFRTRAYPKGKWFGVVYTKPCANCSTLGHELEPAVAHGLCDRCWHRRKYRDDADYRERRKAQARERYASLTPEQRVNRRRKMRVATKLRRWANG